MKVAHQLPALLCTALLLMGGIAALAQDSVHNRKNSRRMTDLFADSTQLSSSDYQLSIENAYVQLTNIDNNSELGLAVDATKDELKEGDSILSVLKDNILNNSKALDLRNLQVFKTLLQNVQGELQRQRSVLDSTDHQLTGLKGDLKKLMGDTVLRQLLSDTTLRQKFEASLKDLRAAWRTTTGKLRRSVAVVNSIQTHISSNSITTVQLQERVDVLLTTSAIRVFGKEYPYLWERSTSEGKAGVSNLSFDKVYDGEKKALNYYFRDSGLNRLFLLLIGGLFFWWVYRNKRVIKQKNVMESLHFTYLSSGIWVAALVIMFSIVPLFDLYAPSTYIEFMQFILMLILTFVCWKKWPRDLFRNWLILFALYISFSFTQHMADPGFWQRSLLILLNIASFIFGLLFLSRIHQYLQFKGFLRFVIILHNILNVMAILCNLWGRVSLSQILGNAAIFSLVQAVALSVFSQIFMEAIQLQVIASRVKLGISGEFDYQYILKSFRSLILFVVMLLWLIVFANNLNIYTSVLDGLTTFLTTARHIGNASFTFGGILLFFLIIWVAHLLQRYIGYFFGDIDTEEEIHDKKQRSRMLVIKLVLLCLGYLLAVAASGIPVDKITIVIGALGVGIGLGLQNIVNNFVSGIVLIFDRPLQIGDVVEISEKEGKVREIGLRSTTLLTDEGAEVIIPNGDILSQQIVNWTLTNSQRRIQLEQRICGSNDMEVVASTIKNAVTTSKYVNLKREPQILFVGVHEEGFDVKIFFWIIDVNMEDEASSDALAIIYRELHVKDMKMLTIPEEERPIN